MTTSKPPTPQAISRLLKAAGFERSTYGDTGVMWNEATDGFRVWKSCHHNTPQQPFVAVEHTVLALTNSDEEWVDLKTEMLVRLGEYAAVIEDAGYHPVIHDRGQDPPRLTIPILGAKEGD